jgi:hypothetical protein
VFATGILLTATLHLAVRRPSLPSTQSTAHRLRAAVSQNRSTTPTNDVGTSSEESTRTLLQVEHAGRVVVKPRLTPARQSTTCAYSTSRGNGMERPAAHTPQMHDSSIFCGSTEQNRTIIRLTIPDHNSRIVESHLKFLALHSTHGASARHMPCKWL